MKQFASHHQGARGRLALAAVIAAVAMLLSLIASPSTAATVRHRTFASPDDAVKALVAAVRAHDEKELLLILGPGSRELISSGDEVADKTDRERFLSSYEQANRLERKSATTAVVHVGPDQWTMPIPIVKKGSRWAFDVGKGKNEILKRSTVCLPAGSSRADSPP